MSIKLGAERYTASGLLVKRSLDVLVSSIFLVVLSPLLLIIAVTIRLTSSGPAVFCQTRVGFNDVPFIIFKFRTMAVDSSEDAHREFVQAMLSNEISPDDALDNESGSVFKLVNDQRITPLGKLLRRTSLDELPQLLNVLRGEMSLVGPRPCLEYEVSEYLPRHRLRSRSIPGMTGLWQVAGRNDLHMLDALDLDLTYVQTCGLRVDLAIIMKTARVLARGSGS